eukprot:5011585-Pleurochrysis_carterae.AAC.1
MRMRRTGARRRQPVHAPVWLSALGCCSVAGRAWSHGREIQLLRLRLRALLRLACAIVRARAAVRVRLCMRSLGCPPFSIVAPPDRAS